MSGKESQSVISHETVRRLAREGERERLALLVDQMVEDEKPGRAKLMLAIAAKVIRRGRHLSDEEKWENVLRFAAQPDEAQS